MKKQQCGFCKQSQIKCDRNNLNTMTIFPCLLIVEMLKIELEASQWVRGQKDFDNLFDFHVGDYVTTILEKEEWFKRLSSIEQETIIFTISRGAYMRHVDTNLKDLLAMYIPENKSFSKMTCSQLKNRIIQLELQSNLSSPNQSKRYAHRR